jgi:outer membrane protein OmpA-like peptidoglycan-associated protein
MSVRLGRCALLAVACGFPALLQAQRGQDHPLISRFPGADIKSNEVKEFDEIVLPVSRTRRKAITPSQYTSEVEKTIRLEGKITRLVYTNPPGRASLEIFRSYEQALTKAGFQVLFTCSGTECGDAGTNDDVPGVGRWCVQALDCSDVMRYVAAKATRQTGDVYVAVKTLVNGYSTAGTVVNVVELTPMKKDLVTVNAEAMRSDITAVGHTPLYGVYFDTGKAEIKPESDATLAEIAKLLQANAMMKLHVVGHTDNVGTPAANTELSRQRAAAVVTALTSKYKIASSRLDSAGVGALSPVATNRTEQGRAKNRRVELVEW